MNDLRQLADDYFSGMRSRDVERIVAKFAPRGTILLPDGREVSGEDALRALYSGLFAANPPTPSPRNFVVGPDQVAVEIDARLDDGSSRRTANFFRFDDQGRIELVSIYRRG
jgi:ketosteroid isomerase-like protein